MNHTTNYNLPLYTAQDETNYMTNWNDAMTSIDTAVKAVDDKPVVDQVARDGVSNILSILPFNKAVEVYNKVLTESDSSIFVPLTTGTYYVRCSGSGVGTISVADSNGNSVIIGLVYSYGNTYLGVGTLVLRADTNVNFLLSPNLLSGNLIIHKVN